MDRSDPGQIAVSGQGCPRRCHQTGIVLLLCLLFLTALTMVGLAATADTFMQGRLATNLQDSERALQAALSAQAWAENWLLGQSGTAPQTCSTPCAGVYLHAGGSLPEHLENEAVDWWVANGHEAGIDPDTGARLGPPPTGRAQPAYWLIETLSTQADASDNAGTTAWYRILARGVGRSNVNYSVVESVLVRSWSGVTGATGGNNADTSGNNCSVAGGCGRMAWRVLR